MPLTEGEIRAAAERYPPGWVYVKTLDGKGRVLSEKWEYETPPELVVEDGFAQFPAYVERLFASQNWFTTLGAFTRDGEQGVHLWKQEGQIQLHEAFLAKESEAEKRARLRCREEGFPIAEDYTTEDGTRILAWNLPYDVDSTVETMRWFASDIRGITAEEALEFSLKEHEDERNDHPGLSQISLHFTYPIEDPSAPAPR